ncbi:transposase [Pseudanabaena sp. PCC 6802]|uniref:transposase n=1 Tax=Pseudanabaena sp. PCC 6802 TaxID=118173 RepID=UPI000346AEDF|nr:transposase [Pseudanabaena sp. PCC 6802]
MRRSYNTDLSNQEWEIIAPMLPKPSKWGRPPKTNMRELLNAIFYILKNGCTWQNLPHDFPPYSTVYFYWQRWERTGLLEEINRKLSQQFREKVSKEATRGDFNPLTSLSTTWEAPVGAGLWDTYSRDR